MRIETTNLKLGMWADGENPGAGTQNQAAVGTGLNDNWKILDNGLGAAHNADGTHKPAVIDAAHLKSTVADGVTIVQDPASKKLKVPDGGIGSAQLGGGAVGAAALAAGAVSAGKIAPGAVGSSELAAGAVGTTQLLDGGVTAAKVADATLPISKLDASSRILSAVCLYAGPTEAGAAAGQSASAGVEWQETSTSDVIKLRCLFFKQAGMKYLRLYGKGRTSDPAQSWVVTMLAADYAGSVLASANASGTNTVYNTYAEAAIAIDISGLAGGAMYEVYVKLRTGGNGAYAFLKQVQIVVTA